MHVPCFMMCLKPATVPLEIKIGLSTNSVRSLDLGCSD